MRVPNDGVFDMPEEPGFTVTVVVTGCSAATLVAWMSLFAAVVGSILVARSSSNDAVRTPSRATTLAVFDAATELDEAGDAGLFTTPSSIGHRLHNARLASQ